MADIHELIQPPRGRRLRSVGEPLRRSRLIPKAPAGQRKPLRSRFTIAELRLVLLLGAAIGLGAASAVDADPSLFGPAASVASVQPIAVRVVDGDTFWMGADKIRIADIDTPEVRARCPAEAALAAQATARLRVLLAEGPFELHGDDTDRYGRKLRIVTRDGRSIGDMLVAEGLARTWGGRREPWCA